MPAKPFISVIIPHLNQSEALGRCLESLIEQSYPRELFEVIVVDNGSQTEPVDLVGRFEGVSLATEQTPGPGPARNRGVEACRGEILAFIDADCIADSGWLKAIARTLQRPEARVIAGGDVRIAVRDAGRLTAIEAYESVFAFRQKEYIEKKGFSGTGNLAVRRRDFDTIGPFAGIEVAEDTDWGRRAGACGYQILYIPEMIVSHPARRNITELCAKWDRHILHDFRQRQLDGLGKLAWCLRALAVPVSAIVHIPRVAKSHQIAGFRERLMATLVLLQIRAYRGIRMLSMAVHPRAKNEEIRWNVLRDP